MSMCRAAAGTGENTSSISVSERLKYHNQFVLGPRFVEGLSSWRRITVNGSLCLTVHPNLKVSHTTQENRSITLLGFILDPYNPELNDSEIIDSLMHNLRDGETFFEHTYRYGGRWILIADDGRNVILFNDAAGLRQVFYTDRSFTSDLWCASQPAIISEILGFDMDGEAVDFIDSYEFRKNPEFRFPGAHSPFREIRHLLPNHCLDLRTGKCRRYWPDRPLERLPLDGAIETGSRMFRGLLEAAHRRFELAPAITAGLDSRLVVAASREVSETVSYMTVRQIGMPEDHPDVAIPSLLFSKLGLRHDIVKSSLIVDDEFLRVFKKNVPVAHYIYAPDAQAILHCYGQRKVTVTGGASEIARSSFRVQLNKPLDAPLLPEDLAKLQGMGKHRFALDAFEEWLAGLDDAYNLDPLDLFEWEQGHGNWLAMCQLEFDIAWKDIFTPYNCRNLLITLLSVDTHYRRGPGYELYERLIRNLWPEVLGVPINPHRVHKKSFSSTIKSFVRAFFPNL